MNELTYHIIVAILNGYSLCKVDEVINDIERYSRTLGTRYFRVEQKIINTEDAIDVIKEACK